VSLDQRLLDILACPQDHGPLYWFEPEQLLYNPRLHRAYDVRDGIPIMLIDEAHDVDDARHDELMALVAERGLRPTFAA
jgi:uncharacterized protein YbaR (Trm112 family)